jgi:hypothetical protein
MDRRPTRAFSAKKKKRHLLYAISKGVLSAADAKPRLGPASALFDMGGSFNCEPRDRQDRQIEGPSRKPLISLISAPEKAWNFLPRIWISLPPVLDFLPRIWVSLPSTGNRSIAPFHSVRRKVGSTARRLSAKPAMVYLTGGRLQNLANKSALGGLKTLAKSR